MNSGSFIHTRISSLTPKMKILLLDIETAPNTAYVWGLFKQNIPISSIVESSYTLCWAAKWYGEKQVFFDSRHKSSHKTMLKGIHKLMEESDAIVHYNGSRFDIPTLNKEFLLHNFKPPAPSKQMDLLQVARRQFRFPSNRLDYVANALGLGQKHKTTFDLWVDCMAKDPTAWKKMESYNKQDVLLLEKVYDKLKPWIKHHANHSLYNADSLVCPNCGSKHYQRRGYAYTSAAKYARFQCKDCGNWFRSGGSQAPKPALKNVNIGV
jgi:DNA polymerase elongation subunit (family B)